MAKVKVTRKFQVTIPVEVRRKIGVTVGDELLVKDEGKRIVFEKATNLDALAGAWTHIEDTEDFMQKVRKIWGTWKRPS